MAKRPVFIAKRNGVGVVTQEVEFQFFNGFALSQKQKSIESLHSAFKAINTQDRILEISSKSQELLGVNLSAFNLKYTTLNGERYSVESIFQSGKKFEKGGPYIDLLQVEPWVAKKDPRLQTSGALSSFIYAGQVFPLEPKTFFYDWIYVNALNQNNHLAEEILQYSAFTDIEFNPGKSINCQAKTAALFISLFSNNLLDKALESPEQFEHYAYKKSGIQLSF